MHIPPSIAQPPTKQPVCNEVKSGKAVRILLKYDASANGNQSISSPNPIAITTTLQPAHVFRAFIASPVNGTGEGELKVVLVVLVVVGPV